MSGKKRSAYHNEIIESVVFLHKQNGKQPEHTVLYLQREHRIIISLAEVRELYDQADNFQLDL